MSKRRKVAVDVHVPERGDLAPFVGYYANANPHVAGSGVPGFELHQHQLNERVQRHILVGKQVGQRGEQDSPLELEEVIFGMRCSSAVMFAVIQALEGRDRPVRFYKMRSQHGLFRLVKRVVDTDELLATLPRRTRSIHEMFSSLDDFDA